MDEAEQYWTLENHLMHGRSAIGEITSAPPDTVSHPRICFHLYPTSRDDDDNLGMEATYCQLAKSEFERSPEKFDDIDFVGGPLGVEAWQYVMPTLDWLAHTVPLVWDIAAKANMSFEGWSFEPRIGPYVVVSQTVNVFDGNKLIEIPTPHRSAVV